MPKPFKVKRYNRIYRSRRSPSSLLLRGLGTLVAVCVLGFIGWSAYGPVMDYFSGVNTPLDKPVSANSTPIENPPEAAPEQTPAAAPAPAAPTQIKAVYIPPAVIADSVKLDALLEQLSLTEINAVMFDLKNTAGNVLYESKLELVKQAGSQSEDAFDLSALCDKLNAKNIVPIGRLHAFHDPIAASHIPNAGIKYMNTEMLWLDNAADTGGKPWLNPYSELAQAYITDIATECVSLGVKRLMLDSMSFPTGYGQEYASYGSNAANVTRPEALSSFIDAVDTQVGELSGELNIYISALAALGAHNSYYGSNPLTLSNNKVTIGVMPDQFGDGFTLESFSLEAPVLHPGETVDSLLKFIAPDIAGMQVTAMVQGYNASYTVKNNMVYTAEAINAQIAALSANHVESYIIYNPDGNYPK
ncbi:putative glycoside hydrolase [Oscillospiraceae bacterium PP1C4]